MRERECIASKPLLSPAPHAVEEAEFGQMADPVATNWKKWRRFLILVPCFKNMVHRVPHQENMEQKL
jgi:hypothetical protein